MNTLSAAAFALVLPLLALGTGCSRGMDHESSPSLAAPPVAVGASAPAAAAPAEPPSAGEPLAGGATASTSPRAAGRALVVTLDLALQVTDVPAAQRAVRAEVQRTGGYVADASLSGRGSYAFVKMDLRVPTRDVDNVRTALARIGELTADSEKVQDVTEERADLEARLVNARASEKRVLEIMATKAGAIHDVIEAEKEVSRIRESIERMEAQKRTLDGKVDYSTVHVTLSMPPAPPAPLPWQTPGKSIAAAGRAGLSAAQAVAVYGLCAFVATAPFLLPLGAVVAVLVLTVRARRRAALRALSLG